MTPAPGWRKCTVYRRPGAGGMPLVLRLSEGLGGTVASVADVVQAGRQRVGSVVRLNWCEFGLRGREPYLRTRERDVADGSPSAPMATVAARASRRLLVARLPRIAALLLSVYSRGLI